MSLFGRSKSKKEAETSAEAQAKPRAVVRSDAEWRSKLDPMQYQVTRHAATERAFTGRYWDHFERGHYDCVCCGTPLFESSTKYDAGCGWPSYWRPVNSEVIERVVDRSHGMVRIEVRCNNCGAHLGHVFDDGPAPTGERYCINSASLDFEPAAEAPPAPAPASSSSSPPSSPSPSSSSSSSSDPSS